MSREAKKWFSSDWHIAHKKITEYTNRSNETSQEDHDAWLVSTINSQVHAGDLIYILGDVSFATDVSYTAEVLKSIKGQKIVIKGNHDKSKDLDYLKESGIIQAWYDYKEIKIQGITTCLFHFPIMHWNKARYGSFHLHGHLHGDSSGVEGRILDVGIDKACMIYGEHRLFSEQDIINLLGDIEVKNHH